MYMFYSPALQSDRFYSNVPYRFGYSNCLSIVCLGYVARLSGNGLIQSPWQILLVNCLHSITYAMMFTAATAQGSYITPPAFHGTIQGTLRSINSGFGKFTGFTFWWNNIVTGHIHFIIIGSDNSYMAKNNEAICFKLLIFWYLFP